jgi:hypothetical protein
MFYVLCIVVVWIVGGKLCIGMLLKMLTDADFILGWLLLLIMYCTTITACLIATIILYKLI